MTIAQRAECRAKPMKSSLRGSRCHGMVTPRRPRRACDCIKKVTYAGQACACDRNHGNSGVPGRKAMSDTGHRIAALIDRRRILVRHPGFQSKHEEQETPRRIVILDMLSHSQRRHTGVTLDRWSQPDARVDLRPGTSTRVTVHLVLRRRDSRFGITERRHTTQPGPTPRLACRSRSALPRLHCS